MEDKFLNENSCKTMGYVPWICKMIWSEIEFLWRLLSDLDEYLRIGNTIYVSVIAINVVQNFNTALVNKPVLLFHYLIALPVGKESTMCYRIMFNELTNLNLNYTLR